MLLNRTELSGSGGKPVEVDHTIDQSGGIPSRLSGVRKPINPIGVTPQKAKLSALLAERRREVGQALTMGTELN